LTIRPLTYPVSIGPENLDGSTFFATHMRTLNFNVYYLGAKHREMMQEMISWAADYDLSGFRFETTSSDNSVSSLLIVYFASESHATVFTLQWSPLPQHVT
jgi:hypothetical protein